MEEASRTTSGLMNLMYASRSWRFHARSAAIRSSTGSGGGGCSDISLRPLLRQAFGGSTSVVDVEVGRHATDQAVVPHADRGFAPSYVLLAASRAGSLVDHGKGDA